jgi:Fe-S-cluster containining protein
MQFPDNVSRLCPGKRFSFACHPGVPCFTECCRELELALTPYDVLRLRQVLQLGSAAFIDRYVVLEEDEHGGFPRLYLGMVDDGRGSCPFRSPEGCRVYENRPGACRTYPVGRGVTLAEGGTVREMHVLVREPHCLGFAAATSHNVAEWFANQGLALYNEFNDKLLGLLQHDEIRRGKRTLVGGERDDFLLALYRLDEFGSMAASPAFYEKHLPDSTEREALLADELRLLRFGIRWLTERLFAEN